ncbi:MAG: hypothetical protein AB1758_01075, partial [Candidatus Eremiobacterota bacterium]
PGPATREVQTDQQGNAYVQTETAAVAVSPRGEILWTRETPSEESVVMTAPGDRVLLLTRDRIEFLDSRGRAARTHALGAPLTRAPVFTPDGTAFFGTEAGVEVLKATGEAHPSDALPGKGEVQDLQADPFGHVVVGTADGYVVCLDSDGKGLRSRDIFSGMPGGLNVRPDGSVLVATVKGEVIGLSPTLELDTIMPLFRGRTTTVRTPLCAPDGSLYLRDSNTLLQVFDPHGRPSFELTGFQSVSSGFSPDGMLAVCDYDRVHLLKERTLNEVLSEPEPEPEPVGRVERRGDWLVVGGRMVKVKKPRF